MKPNNTSTVIKAIVFLIVLITLSPFKAAEAQVSVFTDFASFDAATGPLTEIDFENLPYVGSSNCPPDPSCTLPNPLVLMGVTFTDPAALVAAFCSSPTCQPDPDNPFGGNIVLVLNPGGTIDFPPGTAGAMLVIEGIGGLPFQVKVTDSASNITIVNGTGVAFGVAFLGFASPSGISRIEVLSVGGGGPLGLSAVFFEVVTVTPAQAIQNLITTIGNMGLPGEVANSLSAPLGQASTLLNDNNPSNDIAACGNLDAFINQVNAKVQNGQLTSAQASQLLQAANAIKASLGC